MWIAGSAGNIKDVGSDCCGNGAGLRAQSQARWLLQWVEVQLAISREINLEVEALSSQAKPRLMGWEVGRAQAVIEVKLKRASAGQSVYAHNRFVLRELLTILLTNGRGSGLKDSLKLITAGTKQNEKTNSRSRHHHTRM